MEVAGLKHTDDELRNFGGADVGTWPRAGAEVTMVGGDPGRVSPAMESMHPIRGSAVALVAAMGRTSTGGGVDTS
jgi:hypothetical protein